MKHIIPFRNCPVTWDNALPMGNSNFGGMLYFEDNKLYMPMNHYEVYYTSNDRPFPEDWLKPVCDDPGARHRSFAERADRNQPTDDEPYISYRIDRATYDKTPNYGNAKWMGVHPATGDISFIPNECLNGGDSELTLYVENACIRFNRKTQDASLTVDTITARKDCIVNKVSQSQEGLLSAFEISLAPYRDYEAPAVEFFQIDDSTFGYTASRVFENSEKTFVFSGVVRLMGAKGKLTSDEYTCRVEITESEKDFYILTGIYTQYRYADTLKEGIAKLAEDTADLDALYREHQTYWADFFRKSSISLPDKFLETVYYVNQYALDCCSGENGFMTHQACGLNGLWDVRHPTIWGSRWYWDVNIQAAYAGVFSSNRLNLGKVFSDGLLTYVELAERFAKNVHNMPGVALDFPPQNYYSTWPWCAGYLWNQFEYSGDVEYLRKDAYPLFKKLCEFTLALFQYDEKTDTYYVYPDISPEQGALSHNTTITIASVKYMLQFTLKAAEILGDNDPMLADIRNLLAKMPPYYFSKEGTWGSHLKDAMEAPDNLWLRHPSMLMPIFPTGEFDPLSTDGETLKKLSNTVDYLIDNCETGIFGGSWISAAASRLGRGQTALRLLYERGIDHMLRPNGLTAEQTNRFMNYCLIHHQPLYYPCMMEFTGQMLAAVNEMLLQSYNGVIRVFPAMPDGSKEWVRFHRGGYSVSEYQHRCRDYDAWQDVRFDKLLARGAFEISAELAGGKLRFIRVDSKLGGEVKITSPYLEDGMKVFCNGKEIAAVWENSILSFPTDTGCTYTIAEKADTNITCKDRPDYPADGMIRTAYTKHRISLGETPDTQFYKALDGILYDWFIGDARMTNNCNYKFDFGIHKEKDYASQMPLQAFTSIPMAHTSGAIIFLDPDNCRYKVIEGYGIVSDGEITAKERDHSCLLRKDFLEGTEPAEFVIDTPRGQFDFFVVSGDTEEDSVTIIETENGFRVGGDVVKKGTWQYDVVPVIHKKDDLLRLKISTKPGYKWKLNFLIMNSVKGY